MEDVYYREIFRGSRIRYAGTGYVDKDGKFIYHGKGKLFLPKKAPQIPDVPADLRTNEERGCLFYEGDFVNGCQTGKGRFYHRNGVLRYRGDVQDGEKEGQGVEYYENGTVYYEGTFSGGAAEGSGRTYYESGILAYEGDFTEGNPNGQGKFYNEEDRKSVV